MRWFGPEDPVSLQDIRQAGCTEVVSALHQIPVGEVWSTAAIMERKDLIESSGLSWKVVESLPVHEDIKRRSGDFALYIANYQKSLRHLARCGIEVITYNFMPILDWVRTEPAYRLPNGGKALYFEKLAFIAFDLFLLKRPAAELDYTPTLIAQATTYFAGLTTKEKEALYANVLLGLPGSDEAFTAEQVLAALQTYKSIDADRLRKHLVAFLGEVAPVAEECGLKLAIHPDDPPFPVLGLARIVSTASDLQYIIETVPLKANGICFCTGSLSVRKENELVSMIEYLGDRIHFLHLRNTKSDAFGNFYEADHLAGDVDMVAIVRALVKLAERTGQDLPMRPDHGHQLLDDLHKKTYPGYSAIGRLKGLGELRGVWMGVGGG